MVCRNPGALCVVVSAPIKHSVTLSMPGINNNLAECHQLLTFCSLRVPETQITEFITRLKRSNIIIFKRTPQPSYRAAVTDAINQASFASIFYMTAGNGAMAA